MVRVSTVWGERLLELPAAEEWCERESVLRVVGEAATPGIARHAMLAAQRQERSRRSTTRSRPQHVIRSESGLIYASQRRVAVLAINRNSRVESRGEGTDKQIHLRPYMDWARPADGRFKTSARTTH